MKIIDEEEKNASINNMLIEAAKGITVGLGVSYGLYRFIRYRYPVGYTKFSTSVKASIWAMPTISLGAFFADEGTVKFSEKNTRSDYLERLEKEKLESYKNLSTTDQVLSKLNEHKYKIIVGSWAASLWGSWKIVNKDNTKSCSSKSLRPSNYCGTILLSMHEEKINKGKPAPVPEWKRFLDEQEAKKKQDQQIQH
ncbi:hypothetical protein QCA50_009863 [Cerrena zonata]|uniref:HIG1 domain-containing protein n=1 Tax=Cerrena zonata TaxID=2478898 RepID=A0AAW0G5M6_9APHY